MIKVEKFSVWHMNHILATKPEFYLNHFLTLADMEFIEENNLAYTAVKNGVPVACCGITMRYPHRAEAWAVIGLLEKIDSLSFIRAIRRFLDIIPVKRIEATLADDVPNRKKWIRLLGFQYEARLKCFDIEAKDVDMYVRLK